MFHERGTAVSNLILPGSRNTTLFNEGVRVAVALLETDGSDVLEGVLDHLKKLNEQACDPPKERTEIYDIAYRCMKEASKRKGAESDIKRSVLSRLSSHFRVFEEVWGTHWSGKRMRIDAILTPLDDSMWKTKSPRLGVEFKNFRAFSGGFDLKDYSKWWGQCHDYAETNFDGHGYVPVFSYNGFSHYAARLKNEVASAFAVRFWGRLGVGELRPEELMFVMNGSNKIWSERRGVIDGSRISMERKFGSR